jgi:hypothetical protein
MGSIMELPIAPSRSRSLSWRTGPFVCLAGAMTILLGCLLPHSRIHADNRPYGGTLQSVTYDGLQSVPRAVILLAVLAAILAAVSLGTGRRLRGGWWVVAIGALGTCLIEVVAVLNPTNTLMNSMVQDGIDEGIARELLDRGLYSVEWMIGVWFIVVRSSSSLRQPLSAAPADEHLYRGTDESRQEADHRHGDRPADNSEAQKGVLCGKGDPADDKGKESEPPHQPHEHTREPAHYYAATVLTEARDDRLASCEEVRGDEPGADHDDGVEWSDWRFAPLGEGGRGHARRDHAVYRERVNGEFAAVDDLYDRVTSDHRESRNGTHERNPPSGHGGRSQSESGTHGSRYRPGLRRPTASR